jgi:hypothetical protein
MKINVVARDEKSAERFLERHEEFGPEIRIIRGASSLFSVIDDLVRHGDDIEVFCHDDVFLPSDFVGSVREWVDLANSEWPNWGIAGNAGIPAFQMGFGAHEVVRFLSDPHGGPTGVAETVPCQSIDGNLILLNCARLREAGFALPPFGGFHLYDLVTSIETIRCGLSVHATPALYCYHDSKGSQGGFDKAIKSYGFQSYLCDQIQNREILTINGTVRIERDSHRELATDAIDFPTAAILNAAKGRVQPTLEIITRATFKRDALLKRCCLSVDIARQHANSDVGHTIVTGNRLAPDEFLGRPVVRFKTSQKDDRFELILEATRRSTADYVWFIDDDDWVFPNRIELLLKSLSIVGSDAIIFGETAQFLENERASTSEIEFPESSIRRVFNPEELVKSFNGQNFIPFSACLFPAEVLRALPRELTEEVTYYEDYASILFAVSHSKSPVAFFPGLISGISLRQDESQSVTSESRDMWNKSMAEFGPMFFGISRVGLVSEIMNAVTFKDSGNRLIRDEFIVEHLISQRDEAIEKLEVLSRSWTWRITRPLRVISFLKRERLNRKESRD